MGLAEPASLHRIRPSGFTLIELLVVLAIIAVLMGLAFPAFQSVQNSARRTQAKNDVVQIVTAVNAFYTEYGRYPTTATEDGNARINPGADNGPLLNELRGVAGSAPLNTRLIVFLSPPDAKDQAAPRGGIETETGRFFDPFGSTYGMAMDANYDNVLSNPYSAGAGGENLRQGVIAWSFGKDGGTGSDKNSGQGKDDVISWQ